MTTLILSKYEVNTILRALGEQPYNDVAAVIQHIKEQIEPTKEENHA